MCQVAVWGVIQATLSSIWCSALEPRRAPDSRMSGWIWQSPAKNSAMLVESYKSLFAVLRHWKVHNKLCVLSPHMVDHVQPQVQSSCYWHPLHGHCGE